MDVSMNEETNAKSEEYYDEVYFDSDEESDDPSPGIGLPGKKKKAEDSSTKKVLSDDQLLYDPNLDDEDEAWVNEQIKKAAPKKKKNQAEAKTDAILTCPLCFVPLCFSCQRHDRYPKQYRAMFVRNCKVVRTERYKYKEKGEEEEEEAYYIVRCQSCDTHVAMMDEEEIYHFFNVIAT
ncbi:hypothetical protein EC973_007211 [Apophysomyces ossiformis]|uniref:E2F-associated phosphoprotein n=1 Tax=Apophysomyces ossiformis TaxID=679940 RepID=A0A8H7BV37_9FUNG|nr:hypothetical protein EC973_007211 [Apophysomyces ossiformis]